jgi:hypothetical protein
MNRHQFCYQFIQRKCDARKHGNNQENNRQKRLFEKKATEDKERYYNGVADVAEGT